MRCYKNITSIFLKYQILNPSIDIKYGRG